MLRSLRSRLILASLLWTLGLLALMHMLSLMLLHVLPGMGTSSQATAPVIAGLIFMGSGLVVLRQSLKSVLRLRTKLTAIRADQDRRMDGAYPSEIQPLIEDLNALLEDREKAVKRALSTAGDLAHGLKTPLALLAQTADRAEAEGKPELAQSITQLADRMSRQINYHLARARAAASGPSGSARCAVNVCADALIRTVLKLHAGRTLEISSTLTPDLYAKVQREDLDEMLGNLLDNACKWANSRIVLSATRTGAMLVLTVDDDGPGLAPALRAMVLERGVRIDQASPGSGLGLAIVRDLAELYGGAISLQDSPFGGLQVRLSLPLV